MDIFVIFWLGPDWYGIFSTNTDDDDSEITFFLSLSADNDKHNKILLIVQNTQAGFNEHEKKNHLTMYNRITLIGPI